MVDNNFSEREQQYINTVDDLEAPVNASDVAAELGISASTARNYLSSIDVIKHNRGEGYYLSGDYKTSTETANYFETEIPQEIIDDLQNGGLTYGDFAKSHDLSEDEASNLLDTLEERGYSVSQKVISSKGTKLWYLEDEREKQFAAGDGDGVYEFGLISDTHLGSAEEHLDELHDFYDRLEDRGINTVFHAGDISDGWKVYKHHHQQLVDEAVGWERLREYVITNYPERESIDTYFITGNHDYKLWKRSGIYFGQQIAERRDDLHWLGPMQATIVFHPGENIDLELIHPSGGAPYTLGYRAQTLYRERDPDSRPSLAGIGHLHGRMQANAEGVEAFYTMCWQGPTPYVIRKGLPTEIGGWIVELEIEDGELRRISTDCIQYSVNTSDNKVGVADLAELE